MRRRLASLLVWMIPIAVIGVSVPAISTIRTSFDTRVFLGDLSTHYQDLKRFEEAFRRTSQVFILLAHETEKVSSPRFSSIIRDVTDDAWALPLVTRVDSLANAPHVRDDGGIFVVEPVLDVAQNQKADQVDDPLRSELNLNRFVSRDQQVAAVVITCDVPVGTEDDVKLVANALRDLAERYETTHPELKVLITGEIPLMETFGQAALADSSLLIPLAIVVIVALVQLFVGDWRLVAALVINAAMAACLAMAAFSLQGSLLNSGTSLIPLVLLIVLSANSLHLLLSIKAKLEAGAGLNAAIASATQENRIPVVVASITTAAGFGLLNSADAPPFHDLGTFVAVGVAFGTLTLLLWVPVFLRLGLPLRQDHVRGAVGRSIRALASRADKALQLPRSCWLLLLLAFAGLWGAGRLEIDDNFIRYFDERYEIRRSSEFAAEHLGGPNYLDIQIRARDGETIYSPAYQSLVTNFAAWLRARDNVANVRSIADVLQEVSGAFNTGQDLSLLSEDQIAQYLLTFELSLGVGQDLSDYVEITRTSTRVNALLRGGTSKQIIALERDIYTWFDGRGSDIDKIVVTGINVPTAHMSLVNVEEMLTSLAGSVGFLVLLVGLAFRSFSFALVSLLALVLPISMGFGFWGLLEGKIGMAASAVAALSVGVVIDDAIHLLYRYRQLQRHGGMNPDQAMATARSAVGPAIAITSVALVLGFCLLGFSGFEVNRSLGLCTAIILACAALVDLYLIPPLVVRLDTALDRTSHPGRAFGTRRSR